MSYIAEYWTPDGRAMIGGVRRGRSSRWGTRAEADQSLANTIEINAGVGCLVTGQVVTSPLPPEIFSHCPGTPSQAVGGLCFGCKKKLTWADARAYEEAENTRRPQVTTHHFEPLYQIVRCYLDRGTERVIKKNLTLEEAQAHCRDPETRSKTATSAEARERTRQVGAWVDRFDEQKIRVRKRDGRGWTRVQEQRRVEGPSPERQAQLRHRFAPARPHGLCERAGRCVEHEQDSRIEACAAEERR